MAARLVLLLRRPLWFDEIFTVWASRLSPTRLIDVLRRDSGPPGFYLLEAPLVRFGERLLDTDRLARALPFAAMLLTLWLGARTLPTPTARRYGVVLFASFLLFNLYAAEARAYALLALLVLGLFLLALARPESTWSPWATLAVATLALYVHYLAIFAVATIGVLAVLRGRWRSTGAIAGSVILFAPWIPVMGRQPPDALLWARETPQGSAMGFLSALGGVGRVPSPFGPPPPRSLFVLALALGVAMLVGLAAAARRRREIREPLLLVTVVLGCALVVSFWKPIAFAGRTEMAVLPVWTWALALAADSSRMARLASIAASALGLAATVSMALAPQPPSAAARATEVVSSMARPGDAVIAGPTLYLPLRLAADRGQLTVRLEAFPASVADHPGWWVPAWPHPEDYRRVSETLDSSRTVFLLLPRVYVTPSLKALLSTRGLVRELTLPAEAIFLVWSRAPLGGSPERLPGIGASEGASPQRAP